MRVELNFRRPPHLGIWRLQYRVAAVVFILLLLLPLASSHRWPLTAVLAITMVLFWRQFRSAVTVLGLDVVDKVWRLRTESGLLRMQNCRALYFSRWLIVLSYGGQGDEKILPVFRTSTSEDAFRQLMACIR